MSNTTQRGSGLLAVGLLTLFPFSQAVALPTNPALAKKLQAVRDNIAVEDWPRVVRLLQSVLDVSEDVFVPVRRRGKDGKETVVLKSARTEAGRLLDSLPPKGRAFYELMSNPAARELLDRTRKNGRLEGLSEIVRRYRHTRSGATAARLLATHYLDRGNPSLAARCFRRLLEGRGEIAPVVLFHAALAFHRSGDRRGAERIWRRLASRAPRGLRLGTRQVSLSDLKRRLGSLDRQAPATADWRMFRGAASRLALVEGRPPLPKKQWSRATAQAGDTLAWLKQAEEQQASRSRPALSASFPLALGNRLVYRSHRGVVAVELATGKPLWEASSSRSLDALVMDAESWPHVNVRVYLHVQNNPHWLSENSILGTLSADRGRVYAVEDLPFPYLGGAPGGESDQAGTRPRLESAPALSAALYHNRLLALDQNSGKVTWSRGGLGARTRANPLRDCFFLGPPLPLNGRLYALVEVDQELKLVCLRGASGSLLWTQRLSKVRTELSQDGPRRLRAAPLAHAEGILVCPTNAGDIVALDLVTRNLLWARTYRKDLLPPPPQEFPRGGRRRRRSQRSASSPSPESSWRVSSPLIHRGKVVFTAPDAASVECLDLHTGVLRWKAEFSEGLYLSMHGDKVLFVGKKNCRAVRLTDGKQVWTLKTEEPSGQGVTVGTLHYLPVRGPEGKRPAVHAIDINKGTVIGKTAWPTGEVPGNLLFTKGTVISQTLLAVAAYPQQQARKKQ